MRILVTAGPTREPIDSVRFISNASSGQMGYAVAAAAVSAGFDVTLVSGPVNLPVPSGVELVRFTTVAELKDAVEKHFADCDVLVMSAAVGDFTVEQVAGRKISRKNGPITLTLVPTEDILAGVAESKKAGQIIVAFAVEDGPRDEVEAKARQEMIAKGADISVVNTPAAMSSSDSLACIMGRDAILLPWAKRPKDELAGEIIACIKKMAASR